MDQSLMGFVLWSKRSNHAKRQTYHIIPDGQLNEFKTDKGIVSDWAVSGDAPEWIVAQARDLESTQC